MKEKYEKIWRCGICNCTENETVKIYTEGCKFKKSLCNKHYCQMVQKGKITDESKSRRHEMPWVCDICGSDKKVKQMTKKNDYKGYVLCAKHSTQVYRHGKVLERTMYDSNIITILEDRAEISIYDINQNIIGIAKIDVEDINKITPYKWSLSSSGYAYSGALENNKTMHRYLVDYGIVDHINRDRLDNRKANLRSASIAENSANKCLSKYNISGYTGVGWIKADKCWCARLSYKRVGLYQSGFKNKHDAIIQRLTWEQKYFKEFAPQRHLFAEYGITEEDVNIDK